MSDNNRGVVGFLLGIGIGVGVGILFAPRSGRSTRHRIRSVAEDYAEDCQDRVERKVRHLRDAAEDLLEEGVDAIARSKDRVVAALKP